MDLLKLITLINNCQPNTVLLTWSDGSYVTGSQVTNFLKNACFNWGISHEHVASHSLRKFTVTEAIKDGLPHTIAVQLNRWKSFNSIRLYINLEAIDLVNSRRNLANANSHFANNQNRFRLFCSNPKLN